MECLYGFVSEHECCKRYKTPKNAKDAKVSILSLLVKEMPLKINSIARGLKQEFSVKKSKNSTILAGFELTLS